MSAEVAALVVVVLALTSGYLFVRLKGLDERDVVFAGLPVELANAEIVYAEQTFRSKKHGLVAKLDRAYRVGRGEIALLELKTRSQDAVFMSDIIELSAQRVALQDATGEAVSREAWVVVQSAASGRRRPHRVHLMTVEEVHAMRQRYRLVRAGRIEAPQPARSANQCRTCGHLGRCSAAFRDRGDRATGAR